MACVHWRLCRRPPAGDQTHHCFWSACAGDWLLHDRHVATLEPDLIFIALGTITVGNGLFKANPASLLSKCYPPKDAA
ncbi:hypothetical protein ACLBOM_04310 [Escherichia coli]